MLTKYARIFKKAPSWIYKLGAQSFIDTTFPRHIFLETTATCNLSCSYCPRPKIKEEMDFSLFRDIVDEATRHGARSFSLHLFGEPLLYSRILDSIEYIKSRNRKHTILLTTNGTKLNEFVDPLIKHGVDQIFWSWRTESKFTDETIRKLRSWGRFRVRFIKEITPPEALKEWQTWKNKEIRSIHNYGGNVELEKFGASTTTNGKRWPCYHLWLAPAVGWNGKFLMCCSDPHQKEVFGDINFETVEKCWGRLGDVRKSHLRGQYEGICKDCDVYKSYPDMFFKWQKRVK